MRELAPWRDFAGNEIYNGDVICHPSGERGRVVFLSNETEPSDQWRVDYGEGIRARLCLQIGDKGRAVLQETELTVDEQTLIDYIADSIRPKIDRGGVEPRWWCLREDLKEGARASAIDAVMRWKAAEDLVARKYSAHNTPAGEG